MTLEDSTVINGQPSTLDEAAMRRVLGRVTALQAHDGREPLLFYRGEYGGFA